MRIHVTLNGKKTTISIDDLLFDYLGAWLVEQRPKLHSKSKEQYDQAKSQIRKYVQDNAEKLPSKNLSQHIQNAILEIIMPKELNEIIEKRGPRYEKKKLDVPTILPDWENYLRK